jgi:hypothetical protein
MPALSGTKGLTVGKSDLLPILATGVTSFPDAIGETAVSELRVVRPECARRVYVWRVSQARSSVWVLAV